MTDEPTPILRADATDDELYEPVTTLEGTELAKGGLIEQIGSVTVTGAVSGCDYVLPAKEDEQPQESGTVEPEPAKRLVPVVVSGVLHGYREE